MNSRRRFLATALGASAMVRATLAFSQTTAAGSGVLTKAHRDQMTPGDVLALLKEGNERFRGGKTGSHDYTLQQRMSADAQFPAAVILGCIDSRVPAEIVFDLGIGEIFNARIAGNALTDELLGSLEYGCAVAGAKAVVLMGHTGCGAVKAAIDDEVFGNLTGLLARIKPAVTTTQFAGDRSSKNSAFVDAVARTNVVSGIDTIRRRSPILADLEKSKTIRIVGAMYDLRTGGVDFFA